MCASKNHKIIYIYMYIWVKPLYDDDDEEEKKDDDDAGDGDEDEPTILKSLVLVKPPQNSTHFVAKNWGISMTGATFAAVSWHEILVVQACGKCLFNL